MTTVDGKERDLAKAARILGVAACALAHADMTVMDRIPGAAPAGPAAATVENVPPCVFDPDGKDGKDGKTVNWARVQELTAKILAEEEVIKHHEGQATRAKYRQGGWLATMKDVIGRGNWQTWCKSGQNPLPIKIRAIEQRMAVAERLDNRDARRREELLALDWTSLCNALGVRHDEPPAKQRKEPAASPTPQPTPPPAESAFMAELTQVISATPPAAAPTTATPAMSATDYRPTLRLALPLRGLRGAPTDVTIGEVMCRIVGFSGKHPQGFVVEFSRTEHAPPAETPTISADAAELRNAMQRLVQSNRFVTVWYRGAEVWGACGMGVTGEDLCSIRSLTECLVHLTDQAASNRTTLTMDLQPGTRKTIRNWRDKDGRLHRVNGPAVEHVNGNKDWYWHGTRRAEVAVG